MKLRWRLTLSTLALVAPLLLFLFSHDLYNLRSFLIERESTRLRAQAKPIIDAELLNRTFDEPTPSNCQSTGYRPYLS
ncbi:hypothetical protein [Scytonema millei]|uniref:hypothetical protein n=1 Tax=Scytonema millei TaxID=1245922 RepID=UPI002572D28E|nr:hypothetical protein [Scytonema millei]